MRCRGKSFGRRLVGSELSLGPTGLLANLACLGAGRFRILQVHQQSPSPWSVKTLEIAGGAVVVRLLSRVAARLDYFLRIIQFCLYPLNMR